MFSEHYLRIETLYHEKWFCSLSNVAKKFLLLPCYFYVFLYKLGKAVFKLLKVAIYPLIIATCIKLLYMWLSSYKEDFLIAPPSLVEWIILALMVIAPIIFSFLVSATICRGIQEEFEYYETIYSPISTLLAEILAFLVECNCNRADASNSKQYRYNSDTASKEDINHSMFAGVRNNVGVGRV